MDADEQDIWNYLKAWPKQFISAREICRRAGGKRRFREDPFWANQPLLRMVEKNILENDAAGYYRLKPDERQSQQKRWVSPQIKQMLEESGKGFDGVFETDEPESDEKPGL
jgi:hypothetical protein